MTGNACVYCHIVGDWAIRKVYNSTLASYTANSRYNHEDYHAPPGWGPAYYQGCNSCHSVHAAKILGAPYTAKILRNDPGEGVGVKVDNLPPMFSEARDGVTHVMTTTLTGPSGMQVAWNDSDECRDCHKGGQSGDPANSFPHFTSGAYFLDDA